MKEIKGRMAQWLVRALAVCVLAAPAPALAQAATALWYQIGSQAAVLKESPSSPISLSGTSGLLRASFGATDGSPGVNLAIGAVTGQSLTPGTHNAMPSNVSPTEQGAFPQVYFVGGGAATTSCTAGSAHVTVLEASFDGNQVVRFAANFEFTCYGLPSFGELRINSTVPLTINKPAGSTTPDAIAYPPRTLVTPGSEVLSDSQRVLGINASTPISVSGGAYSINGGPFTTLSGTVANRDTVRLLLNAPTTLGATTSMQLDIGGQSATFTASTYAEGTPVTVLKLQGTPGDKLMQGTSETASAPQYVATVIQVWEPTWIGMQFNKIDGTWYSIQFSTAPDRTTGEFGPVSFPISGGGTGISGINIGSSTRFCSFSSMTMSGHFRVYEYVMSGSTLAKLAMDFEVSCNGLPPTRGELRYNSAWPISSLKASGDATPEPFGFAPRTNQVAGSLVESSPITVYGINAPADISVAGGEYSVNGGPYTSAPGTVNAFDHARVRVTAPTTGGATQTARLTIEGVQGDFSASTYLEGTPVRAVHLEGGVNLDVLPGGPVKLTSSGAYYANFEFGSSASVGFSIGSGQLQPGIYEETGPHLRSGRPSMSLSVGGAEGCTPSSSRFVVLDAAFTGTVLTRFAANFQVWCTRMAPIYGEIRYDSGVTMMRYREAGDTTPDPFAFTKREPVTAGQVVLSNRIGVYGVNAPVSVTISGGEYSKNGGPFTNRPGIVVSRDDIVVRVMSRMTAGAMQSAILNVGGQVGTFSARTYIPGETLSVLDISGSAYPVTEPRFYLAPYDKVSVGPAYSGGPNGFQLGAFGEDGVIVRMEAPPGTTLGIGSVVQNVPSRWSNYTYGMDIESTGGNNPSGAYCGNQVGEFTVRDLAYDTLNNTISRLAVDFRISCPNFNTSLKGEYRYNSAVPIARFEAPIVVRKRDGFDANNDGRNDLLFQHADGRAAIWLMSGTAPIGSGNLIPASTGWSIALQGDFDGDGKSDLLWKHTDGRVAMWLMNGATLSSAATLIGPGTGWSAKLVADFNGDGKSDILWEHSDGRTAMWLMNGTTLTAAATLINAATGWSAVLAGDVSGDGKADILWMHTDGRPSIWLMNGTQLTGGGVLFGAGTGWSPKLMADLNGDGRTDIVWSHTDGRVSAWLMNGTTASAAAQVANAGNAYVPQLAGDINGDGKADIILRAADGGTVFWLMNGTSQVGNGAIAGAGSGWTVSRVANFSGDYVGDLVLTNADGRVRMDLFDGLGFSTSVTLLNAGTGWTPVTTR